MTETKSPRNDFVSVLCKHDANCNIRAGLTSSYSAQRHHMHARFPLQPYRRET